MGHVILTTPLLRVSVILMMGLDITYLCTKFDHSSSGRSTYMVRAHQILCGSRDLTTPLSGMVIIRGLVLATINLPTKFEVSISAYYEVMKSDTKCRNWGGLG